MRISVRVKFTICVWDRVMVRVRVTVRVRVKVEGRLDLGYVSVKKLGS